MADAWATVESLADDTALGASEIAERAARALVEIPPSELPDALETLLRGHPEMAPLWRLASEMLTSGGAGSRAFLDRLAGDSAAVQLIGPLLPDRLLTISYSSTVRDAVVLRRPLAVLCMASEPGGEGARMAEALAGATDATVIDDATALADVPAEAVLVGADAVTPTAVVNKAKTADLAEAARDHAVPCFVVAGATKFVPEELPVADGFQASPLKLFTALATPMGLLTPSEAGGHAEGAELHHALRALIARFDEDDPEADAEPGT
ncbi:MAG: hypothetical protein ABR600_14100 [Actinomycetota bacterium]